MRILACGAAGFIGSNWVLHRKATTTDHIIVVDKLSYAGTLDNLLPLKPGEDFDFIKCDIASNPTLLNIMMREADLCLNFASNSHVDRSISTPTSFTMNNIGLMQNVLEACRSQEVPLVHISTDETVHHYPPTKMDYGFGNSPGSKNRWYHHRINEWPNDDGSNPCQAEFNPRSPYAASKAAQEMLCNGYKETFGLPIDIIRCVNNYGPRQYPEKLLPLAIKSIAEGKPIPVYGKGEQWRDWLYVEDFCTAIDTVIKHRTGVDIWHVSAYNETQNINLIKQLINLAGGSFKFVEDRLGHDFSYSLDSSKIRRLGWTSRVSLEEGLKRTVEWYVRNSSSNHE